MRMRPSGAFVMVGIAMAVAGCSQGRVCTVGEIREKGVAGLLGKPLGTEVVVSGVVVPNESMRKAEAGEAVFLEVTRVDGEALDKPVRFPFRKAHPTITAAEPMVGKGFTYRGFETGRFEGVPLTYEASWQEKGFGFTTEFVVLADR